MYARKSSIMIIGFVLGNSGITSPCQAFLPPQSSCVRIASQQGLPAAAPVTALTATTPRLRLRSRLTTCGLANDTLQPNSGAHRGSVVSRVWRQREGSGIEPATRGRRLLRDRNLAPFPRSAAGNGGDGEEGPGDGENPDGKESESDSVSNAAAAAAATTAGGVVNVTGDADGEGDGNDNGGGGGGKTGGGASDPAMRSSLKRKLLLKVATLNRGFVANEADRADVEEIVEMLEFENPNPGACAGFATQTSPVAGRWQLLYTTSLDVLSLQLNPSIVIGQIFQQIDVDGRGIRNIIELQPPFSAVSNRFLGSTVSTLTVKLETEPVTSTRINLKFARVEIKADSLFGRKLDLPSLGIDIPSSDSKSLRQAWGKSKARVKGSVEKARDLVAKRVKDVTKDEDKEVADDDANKNGTGIGDDGAGALQASSEGASGSADVVESSWNDETGKPKHDPPTAAPSPSPSASPPSHPSSSSSSPSPRTPFFETTYVDDAMRVGRTGDGDIYISTRA